MNLEEYLKTQYQEEITNFNPKVPFKNMFFGLYDKKVKTGEISFMKMGMDKDAFICLSTDQDHELSRDDIARLCFKMKLTLFEAEEMMESAGYEKRPDAQSILK